MTEQEWAISLLGKEMGNFREIFPDLTEEAIAYFGKEAAKNDAGELSMRRFEIFKFGDLETTEGFWHLVIKHIDEIS